MHLEQDPEAEEVAIIAAACIATMGAAESDGDPFAHADASAWWQEGVRFHHGRFPR